MPNKWWNKTGADAQWNTVTGNWWDDAAFTEQAAAIPQTNDFVYLCGETQPSTAPSAVTLSGFDTQGLLATLTGSRTANITIAAGGTLVIGDPAAPGDFTHSWGGDASLAATSTFYDLGINALTATVGDHATFNAGTTNYGTVGDYATFNAASAVGNIEETSGVIGNYATFNDAVSQYATVGTHSTWNGASLHTDGTVGEHATFNGTTEVDAADVGAYSTWNEQSKATLNPNSVGEYATINSTAIQRNWYIGTTIYVGAAVTFDADCEFKHVGGSINFVLLNSAASVTGAFTSDGGTTPVEAVVTVRPDPKSLVI